MCALRATNGFLAALFLLLLAVYMLMPCRHRCPRTGRPAPHASTIRFGDRCYRLQTCSEACAAHLQGLPESSLVQSHGAASTGDGLRLHDPHGSAQVLEEVPCPYM